MTTIGRKIFLPITSINAEGRPLQASLFIGGSCTRWLHFCRFSSSSTGISPLNRTEEGDDKESSVGTSSSPSRRSPAFAAVIREGLPYLNQAALYIQQSKHTRKPLDSLQDRDVSPTISQQAEEYRLYSVASECLDELCRKDPDNALTIQEEPIVFLQAQVSPSFQHATLYWTLPMSILMDDGLTESQRHRLTLFLHEKIVTPETRAAQALAQVQRKLVSRLFSSYKRTPKIRWEPAAPEMVYAFQQYHRQLFDNNIDETKGEEDVDR